MGHTVRTAQILMTQVSDHPILAVWCCDCRYASLPNGASAKREWHKLVMAIEGPTEPTYMDAFLEPLVENLQQLAPPQPGTPPPTEAQPSFSSKCPWAAQGLAKAGGLWVMGG